MGNGNGKHAALWEVCRAFRRQEQHVCNWAKENKKKIKSKQDPLSTQSFFLLLTYLSKSASPSNHIYKSSNTFYMQEARDYSSNHEGNQAKL